MLKKLYGKSEIWFAVAWIIAYVVLASAGDNISADFGIEKIVTLPILIALSAILYFFVRKNGLTEKYGLCKPRLPAAKMLFYAPLLVLLTANLWYGAAMNLSPHHTTNSSSAEQGLERKTASLRRAVGACKGRIFLSDRSSSQRNTKLQTLRSGWAKSRSFRCPKLSICYHLLTQEQHRQ